MLTWLHKILLSNKKEFFFLTLFLLSIVQFYFLGGGELDNLVFNADYTYLPALYKSVIEQGDAFQLWYLTPAPYFFPDMPIYAFFASIFPSFQLALIVSNAFQFTLLAYLLHTVLSRYAHAAMHRSIIYTGIAFLFVIGVNILCGDYFLFHFLFTLTNHTGNLINTLLAMLLFERLIQSEKHIRYGVLIFFIIQVFYISDNLFLLTFIIPACVISIYHLIISRFKSRYIMLCLGMAVSIVTGILLSNNLRFFAYKTNKAKAKWSMMDTSIENFLQSMEFFTTHFWPLLLILGFGVVYAIVVILLKLWKQPWNSLSNADILLGASLMAMLLSLAATIFGGLHMGIDTARYYIVPVFAFIFISASHALARISISNMGWTVFSVLIFLYGGYRLYFAELEKPKAVHNYIPPDIQRILEKTEALKLKDGISGYWYAKPLYLFSNGKHTMAGMYDRMFYPYTHITSEEWINKPVFTFAVTTAASPIDRNILQSITLEKYSIGGEDTLWVTLPFTMEKGKKGYTLSRQD
jgi:hypothetical protein